MNVPSSILVGSNTFFRVIIASIHFDVLIAPFLLWQSQPEPHSYKMQSSEETPARAGKAGILFVPGHAPENLFLCSTHRVIWNDSDGNKTNEHGNWTEWILTDETQMLSITFNRKGSDAFKDIQSINLYQITSGVYRTVTHEDVLIVPCDLHGGGQEHPLLLRAGTIESVTDIKHMFLWLHPTRAPAVVLFLASGKVIYSSVSKSRELTDKNTASPPNGKYEYFYSEVNDTDQFKTCFHCRGLPTETQTLFHRVRNLPCPVWRAIGDEKEISDNIRCLKDWHILMLPLELSKDIQILL